MQYHLLISPAEFEQHYDPRTWVIVDCRFDLANPSLGWQEYQKAHIPGAVYAHLDRDLSGAKTALTGRHPLPEPQAARQAFSRLGIDSTKQVVVYDAAGGSYADRLWWLLRLYGHTRVAVLDGGFPRWQREARPTRSGVETNPTARFTGQPDPAMFVDTAVVEQLCSDPAYVLLDARAGERFRGEVEPIDPVAGHIPGAVNRPYALNLTEDGVFKSPEALRAEFEQLLAGRDPRNVIVYCGSGVTSIHHLLAMELAGLPPGRLYPGSWSEWIRDPARPVEK